MTAPEPPRNAAEELTIFLASSSPARLKVLREAGIRPHVVIPATDERAVEAAAEVARGHALSGAETVELLARAKAESAIASSRLDGVVVGGDTVFVLEGRVLGKPRSAEAALATLQSMRGSVGTFFSGIWTVDNRDDGSRLAVGDISTTTVTFAADVSDAELQAYVGTGEAMTVAGGFTTNQLSAPFVEKVSGDPSGMLGLSVAALRRCLADFGIGWERILSRPHELDHFSQSLEGAAR